MFTNTFSSFSVNDLQKAKDFYGITLGLDVEERNEGLEILDKKVFIYPKESHQPATFTVLNFMVEDIDKVVDELSSKGVDFEHYDQGYMKTDAKGICRNDGKYPGPLAIAWFKDPAGNFLALIQEK